MTSIYAKASLTKEQIEDKMNIGCDGLEIQLLGELIGDRDNGKYFEPEERFELDEFEKYPIKVVHAPIVHGQGDVVLEVLCDKKDFKLLDNVFRIANFFGERRGEKIIAVFHTETYYDKIMDMGLTWGNIVNAIDLMLNKYRYTELVIENVSPLRGIGKGRELHLSNNFAFDNVDMVDRMRHI